MVPTRLAKLRERQPSPGDPLALPWDGEPLEGKVLDGRAGLDDLAEDRDGWP